MQCKVKFPIKEYKQNYHCVIASIIVVLSAFYDNIRKMKQKELEKLERSIFLETRAKPYGNIHIFNVVKYVLSNYSVDDVIIYYLLKSKWR